MDDHATFPRIFGPWVFGDDPETPDYWDFGLAGIEPWLPFPPDFVGIFYPMATFDYWGNRIYGDGNVDCRVGGGWVDFECGAEIITLACVVKRMGARADTGVRPYVTNDV